MLDQRPCPVCPPLAPRPEDPNRQWGNLKQILTPDGGYLWLCDHHARTFKP